MIICGDFNTGACYVASGLPKLRRLEDADFITRPSSVAALSSLPDLSHPNIRVEIENCLQALERRDTGRIAGHSRLVEAYRARLEEAGSGTTPAR